MPAAPHVEILHQATGVALGGRGLLIQGPPGCGKTILALALLDRGAALIGDDGVALTRQNDRLIASPPRATSGLIEIRNVGIVSLPADSAPVALILNIAADAPRYVESASTARLHGCDIPCLSFSLFGAADAIRAEYALRRYGLAAAAT